MLGDQRRLTADVASSGTGNYHQDYCAGQRFRVETLARHLHARGISFSFLPFASPALTSVLYERGHLLTKAGAPARRCVEQTARVLRESRPDVV